MSEQKTEQQEGISAREQRRMEKLKWLNDNSPLIEQEFIKVGHKCFRMNKKKFIDSAAKDGVKLSGRDVDNFVKANLDDPTSNKGLTDDDKSRIFIYKKIKETPLEDDKDLDIMAKEINEKIFSNKRNMRDIKNELIEIKKLESDYRELVKMNKQIDNEQSSNLPSSFIGDNGGSDNRVKFLR